jgi:hypothetical protein
MGKREDQGTTPLKSEEKSGPPCALALVVFLLGLEDCRSVSIGSKLSECEYRPSCRHLSASGLVRRHFDTLYDLVGRIYFLIRA